MAACYLGLDDLENAYRHIELAQERQVDNKYIVDLSIQIACKRRDEETARRLLPLLSDIDDPAFAKHRWSRVEYIFGNPEEAYRLAKEALGDLDRPPFEILANYALYSIRTGRFEDVDQALERLEGLYGRLKRDIQLGLRARAAIAQGRYDDAIGYHAKLRVKDRPVHLAIRRDAIRGILNSTYVAMDDRRRFEQELQELEDRLQDVEQDFEFDLDP